MLVVMADDGIPFDGATAERAPLGGAERAFVDLAEAFAARGHRAIACSRGAATLAHKGVEWRPIGQGLPPRADLFIANRGHRLIGRVAARNSVFWIHNPGGYLKKPRYVARLLLHRPMIVTLGAYHAGTVPWWMPSGGRAVIPLGVAPDFRTARVPRTVPPPRAVFTSNPLRGLDWLLELWQSAIRPAVPDAELHLYCGPAVYGGMRAEAMERVLARAEALSASGVRQHAPVARTSLVEALAGSRVMLYRGDPGETFCLALAEAQALGVPAVVEDRGAVAERIVDGVTGMVAQDERSFAAAAVALLSDDALWRRMHAASLAQQQGSSWDEVARRFEELGPCG